MCGLFKWTGSELEDVDAITICFADAVVLNEVTSALSDIGEERCRGDEEKEW